VNLRIGTQN